MKWVKISKREYLANQAGLGYAVQLLAEITNYPAEKWAAQIADEANNTVDDLTDGQVEELINNQRMSRKKGEKFHISRMKNNGGNDAESN